MSKAKQQLIAIAGKENAEKWIKMCLQMIEEEKVKKIG